MPYYSSGDTPSGLFSLNGKSGLVLAFLSLVLSVWLSAPVNSEPVMTGLCFRGELSCGLSDAVWRWINAGMLAICGIYALSLTKRHNFIPAGNTLFTTAFWLMCAATPHVSTASSGGWLLLLVTLICLDILFSLEGRKRVAEGVFLIFGFLSWGSCVQSGFILMMPLFMLCVLFCGYLNFRSLIAIIFGVAAPYWVLLACGIVAPQEVVYQGTRNIGMLTAVDMPMFRLLLSLGITVMLFFAMLLANNVGFVSAGAQLRARWSCFHLIGFAMVVYMLTDFAHIGNYLPLFFLCTGYECAHWCMRLRTVQKSYLAMSLFAIYIALFAAFQFFL